MADGYLGRLYAEQRRMAAGLAPEDERRDLQLSIFQRIARGLSSQDLADARQVRQQVRASPAFAKAKVLAPTLYQMSYPKAYASRRPKHHAVLYCSDLGFGNAFTGEPWAEKPGGYGAFAFLKGMAKSLDIVQAIIGNYVRRATNYWRRYRPDDANPFGYTWVRNDHERLTKDDQQEVEGLDVILQNCGTESDLVQRRWIERRRTLRGFMDTLLTDSLTADACPVELVRNMRGELIGWHNIAFETIRLAHEDGYDGDDRIVAVQIDPTSRQAVVGFEPDEIAYEVRRPRSDIILGDYGEPELEGLVRTMTVYLNTVAAAAASLDRNTLPRGALILHGEYDANALLDVQASWTAMMTGAANRFKFPILTSKSKAEGGASWIPFDTGANDMLNTKTLTFVCALACADFGTTPEAISLESFSASKSSLSGSDTAEKLQSSHETGFIPLVTWAFEGFLNPIIVAQLTNKYSLVPVGLFPSDEGRKQERLKLTLTVNETRQIDGSDPHPSKLIGDAPVNPTLMTLYVQEQQQKGVLQMPQGPGGEGGAGDDDAPSGRPGQFSDEDFGLTGSEAPLPQPERAGPQSVGGKRPPAQPFHGGRDPGRAQVAKAARPRMVVSIRDVPPDEAWS